MIPYTESYFNTAFSPCKHLENIIFGDRLFQFLASRSQSRVDGGINWNWDSPSMLLLLQLNSLLWCCKFWKGNIWSLLFIQLSVRFACMHARICELSSECFSPVWREFGQRKFSSFFNPSVFFGDQNLFLFFSVVDEEEKEAKQEIRIRTYIIPPHHCTYDSRVDENIDWSVIWQDWQGGFFSPDWQKKPLVNWERRRKLHWDEIPIIIRYTEFWMLRMLYA